MKRLFSLWVSVLVAASTAAAQDVPLAFERVEPDEEAAGDDEYDPFDPLIGAPRMIRTQVEHIELSHKDLTRLMMEDKATTSDAKALRMKVQELVEKDEAEVIDTQILICRSGQKSTVESIREFIYPTEYEPWNSLPPAEGEKTPVPTPFTAPLNPAMPSSFETKNLGGTLEVEPTIGDDDRIIDLRFLPELVWHTGDTVWSERKDELGNVTKVSTPDFYKLSINTSITCIAGQYVLAGALSPKDAEGNADRGRKVMVFVKCDVLPVVP